MVNLAYDLLWNLDDTSTGAFARKGRVLSVTGEVYHWLGEYNQAKELYEKALTIRKQIFGEDHKYVERIRSELAVVNKHLVRSRAEDRHQKACLLIL